MSRNFKKALVVGASTGLGAALVAELVSRGVRVAAVSRNRKHLEELRLRTDPQGLGSVLCHVHDVQHTEEAAPLFERIVEELGGLDLIIYNAGIMPRISPETYNAAQDILVLRVNLLGCVAWLDQAAPFFQQQGQGSIVGISSIAGDRGRRGYPAYNTSKAGMNTFLEALRNRVYRHGVRVTTIKPGYIDTPMTKGLPGLFWLCPATRAARMIVDAARRGAHTRYVPRRWMLVGLIVRCIPSFIFRHLDI